MKDKIEQILIKYDPVGLIKIGAPSDEYDSEAQLIFEYTTKHFSLEKIQQIVYDVFVKQFSGGEVYAMMGIDPVLLGVRPSSIKKAEPLIGKFEKYHSIAEDIKKLLDAP
jgi:hypothetical protein